MPEISRHQKQYLLQYKKEKRLIFTARILLFVLFMGLWEMSTRCGWIDSFIFSSPSLIGKTFLSMCRDQSLFSHIGVTLTETLVSFFFVVILGVGTAILLWCSPKTSRILEPYLVVLNSLPKSALAPLLIVWLGANERTIVVAGMSVAIFGSVINLYSGFCQADPEKLKLIETLGGHKKEKLTKIRLELRGQRRTIPCTGSIRRPSFSNLSAIFQPCQQPALPAPGPKSTSGPSAIT